MTAPRLTQKADKRRVRRGPPPGIERCSVFGGHVGSVDDFFHANGDASKGKRLQIGAAIQPRRLIARLLRIEMLPRLHGVFVRFDPRQQRFGISGGCHPSGPYRVRRFQRSQFMERYRHSRSPIPACLYDGAIRRRKVERNALFPASIHTNLDGPDKRACIRWGDCVISAGLWRKPHERAGVAQG